MPLKMSKAELEVESKAYAKKVRQNTERLKDVRKGTKVQNILSKAVGVATKDINRNHEYVQVEVVRKTGKDKGKKFQKAWWVEHVRIIK